MKIKLDQIMQALRPIQDPHSKKDITTLGFIKDIKAQDDHVSLKLVLRSAEDPFQADLSQKIKEELYKIGVHQTSIDVELQAPKKNANHADKHGVPGVKNLIAVSSGKGGVGKSTVSANLACALAKIGARVGLLDCDIYGPNIPTMMGVDEPPQARMDELKGEMILPLESHGVKVMSMGLLTKGDQPVIWRGPMLHSVVSQFLLKVDWTDLDFLIVDMPPGTGDVQLSLTQLVPVSAAVIVTTPQEVSSQDVRKAILMFEKVGVPILGIVENMSYFVPEDAPEKRYKIFGEGAGKLLSEKFRVPLLAQLPIQPSVCQAGDTGTPIVVKDPDSLVSKSFLDLARSVSYKINQTNERVGNASGVSQIEISGF